MKRTIAIGDLHGCYEDTLKLLDKCKVTKNDRVLFLGDVTDRGPDSGKCLDLAMKIAEEQGEESCILGNHEDKHLSYWAQMKRGKQPSMSPSHAATAAQLTEKHYQYMSKMPLYVRFPEVNAVAVHAGVFPGRTIEKQDRHHLLHIQMIDPAHTTKSMWPSKAPEGWKFWTHFWDGPEKIIFGHSVLDKVLHTDKVCGIDGGSCFGGSLHAVILPTWEIVSIETPIDYGKGRRGQSVNNIAAYEIHNGVKSWS